MGRTAHHDTPPSARKRKKTKFNIFPGGDRVFAVGAGPDMIKARVSGAAVSAASPAFAAMLASGFKESGQKEISLPEEDPDVMLDFFHVVHGQPQNLEHCDGQRIVGLTVMADMWMCAGALSSWVRQQLEPVTQTLSRDMDLGIRLPTPSNMNTKKECLFWEAEKGIPEEYVCSTRSKGVHLSFHIKDLVEIALVFDLDDLLWHASRISLAYSRYGADNDIASRVAIPPKGKGPEDLSVHNVIARSSRKYTSKFLDEVISCLDRDFVCRGILELDIPLICRRGQLLRNAMLLFLVDEGFPTGRDENDYPHSLKQAIQSVGKLIYSVRTDYFFKKMTMKKCGLQEIQDGNGKCVGCMRDFQADLTQLISRYLRELPGICRRCYTEEGQDFFTGEQCPTHG